MSVIRAGLFFLFAFCVLAFGAVEVWSRSVLEIGGAVLFSWWAFLVFRDPGMNIEWNPLNLPLLALLAVGVLQFVFRTAGYSYCTRAELLRLSAYIIVFFLTAQAFRSRAELTQAGWFLICFGFLVSLFGIVQRFTFTHIIYWFREVAPLADPFGPYVNRNHFAGFVELTAPVGLSLMVFRGLRRELIPLATLLAFIPVSPLRSRCDCTADNTTTEPSSLDQHRLWRTTLGPVLPDVRLECQVWREADLAAAHSSSHNRVCSGATLGVAKFGRPAHD